MINKYIHYKWVGSGAEKMAGSGEFAVSQVQRLLCCSPVSEDTSFLKDNHKPIEFR